MEWKRNFGGCVHKRRRGILIVNVLIVFAIIMIIFVSLQDNTDMIYVSSVDRLEALCASKMAEGEVAKLCGDKDFKKELSKFFYREFENNSYELKLLSDNMFFTGKEFKINHLWENTEDPAYSIISIENREATRKSFKNAVAYYRFINPKFVEKTGLIDSNNPNFSEIELSEFIDDCIEDSRKFADTIMEKKITNMDFHYTKILDINYSGYYSSQITATNEFGKSFVYNNPSTTIFVFTDQDKETVMDVRFHTSKSNNLLYSGIIELNGDIIIEDNMEFKGIIILNGGRIVLKNDSTLKISGLVISKQYIEVDEKVKIKYSHKDVLKYGSLIPNFIDLELFCVKE